MDRNTELPMNFKGIIKKKREICNYSSSCSLSNALTKHSLICLSRLLKWIGKAKPIHYYHKNPAEYLLAHITSCPNYTLHASLDFHLLVSLSPLTFSVHQTRDFQAFLQMGVSTPFPQQWKQREFSSSPVSGHLSPMSFTAQEQAGECSMEYGWAAVPLFIPSHVLKENPVSWPVVRGAPCTHPKSISSQQTLTNSLGPPHK